LSKIGQTVLKIPRFFVFQDGRRPPYWIFKFSNLWSIVSLGGLTCIAIPNFTEIGQMVAEMSHLTFFKMAAVRQLGFLKVRFFE